MKNNNIDLLVNAVNQIAVRKRNGKKIKTTRADLKQYTAHLLYWLDRFGLKGYCRQFEVTNVDSDAVVDIEPHEKNACFQLGEERVGDLSIPYLAQHEALECLLGNISTTLETTYSKDLVKELTHEVIHTLQSILPLPTDRELK